MVCSKKKWQFVYLISPSTIFTILALVKGMNGRMRWWHGEDFSILFSSCKLECLVGFFFLSFFFLSFHSTLSLSWRRVYWKAANWDLLSNWEILILKAHSLLSCLLILSPWIPSASSTSHSCRVLVHHTENKAQDKCPVNQEFCAVPWEIWSVLEMRIQDYQACYGETWLWRLWHL